jgi:hypothetical protein
MLSTKPKAKNQKQKIGAVLEVSVRCKFSISLKVKITSSLRLNN